jgi:hypothetical protein
VQTWLTIEKDDIAVLEMPFDNITDSELGSHILALSELQKALEASHSSDRSEIGTWPFVRAIDDGRPQQIDIMLCNAIWKRKDLGNSLRHSDFVDTQIWIWRNDCPA